MHINPEKVSFNGFAILFEILSVQCDLLVWLYLNRPLYEIGLYLDYTVDFFTLSN